MEALNLALWIIIIITTMIIMITAIMSTTTMITIQTKISKKAKIILIVTMLYRADPLIRQSRDLWPATTITVSQLISMTTLMRI